MARLRVETEKYLARAQLPARYFLEISEKDYSTSLQRFCKPPVSEESQPGKQEAGGRSSMSLLELIERDTDLRRVAGTRGGEYAGPCPWCGGEDRFRVWPDADRPGYWCRGCGRHGDAIQYLRDHDGMTFRQACEHLGINGSADERRSYRNPAPKTTKDLVPPDQVWQNRASAFCRSAAYQLWNNKACAEALAYLKFRGLKDETIRSAQLGYLPGDRYDPPANWGLDRTKPLWLPKGIVIPCVVGDVLWRVNVRRWAGDQRYVALAGSASTLYHADLLDFSRPALLLESELDALLVQQEASDLVTALATGGSTGARHPVWVQYLARAPETLIGYDADERGEEASIWWLAHQPRARRVSPMAKDPSEMHLLGQSVRAWVKRALT